MLYSKVNVLVYKLGRHGGKQIIISMCYPVRANPWTAEISASHYFLCKTGDESSIKFVRALFQLSNVGLSPLQQIVIDLFCFSFASSHLETRP